MEVRREYNLIKIVTPEQLYAIVRQLTVGDSCEDRECERCPLHTPITHIGKTTALCAHLEELGIQVANLENNR